MTAARTCPSCQLIVPRPEALFCERCGTPLEPSDSREAPGSSPASGTHGSSPASGTHGSSPAPGTHGSSPAPSPSLDTLRTHPELARLLAATPTTPELSGRTLPSLLLLLGLTVLGLFAAVLCFQLCPPLGFVPLVLVLVGAGVIARQLLWNARTPLVARPALVRELRASVQAGARHSPDHTRHFATLQFDDESQAELECYPSSLSDLEAGAIGVAYLKGERVAAFTRVTP